MRPFLVIAVLALGCSAEDAAPRSETPTGPDVTTPVVPDTSVPEDSALPDAAPETLDDVCQAEPPCALEPGETCAACLDAIGRCC